MSRYDDGSGYICDSEQEEDWFQGSEMAYCFAHITEDGNGGLKATARIYSERCPTVAHKPGTHVYMFCRDGKDLGDATLKCMATLVTMFPGLKVSHG